MSERSLSLDDFGCADPREFVDTAYRTILGRAPSDAERERMLEALLTGSTRPLMLGTLRYGEEGSARAVDVRGLRARYLVQRLFRIPVIGAALEWASAVMRLPRTLRFFRGSVETQGVRHALVQEQYAAEHATLVQRTADAERRLSDADRATADLALKATMLERALADLQQLQVDEAAEFRAAHAEFRAANAEFRDAHAQSRAQHETLAAGVATGAADLRALGDSAQATRARLDSIHPPALPEVLVMAGEPLAALARERAGIAADQPIDTLSAHARYALFETVFYESRAVAAKQRVYIPYLDRELARRAPFLDLGCGRGEFLQILRETRIDSIGVDINADVLQGLRADGFTVVEQDVVAFLESEQRMFSGASMLQVAEHLAPAAIERLLALVALRLLPSALLIVETPNPLSPFALGVFHTDPTHISPIPPERMRYSIEAAGFERAKTLYQARIPADQFAGPDPRAYYADYAIVAYRTADRRPGDSVR